jgi:hypothetical protein
MLLAKQPVARPRCVRIVPGAPFRNTAVGTKWRLPDAGHQVATTARRLGPVPIFTQTTENSTVTPLDLLPEFRFTDSGLICDGRANVAYESIDAITFKLLPLIRNRLSRTFYGVDTTVVFGSSSLMPKLALHRLGICKPDIPIPGGSNLWRGGIALRANVRPAVRTIPGRV